MRQRLARPVAYGIHVLAIALRPLVLLSAWGISRSLRGGKNVAVTSVEEIRLLARAWTYRGSGRRADRGHHCRGVSACAS